MKINCKKYLDDRIVITDENKVKIEFDIYVAENYDSIAGFFISDSKIFKPKDFDKLSEKFERYFNTEEFNDEYKDWVFYLNDANNKSLNIYIGKSSIDHEDAHIDLRVVSIINLKDKRMKKYIYFYKAYKLFEKNKFTIKEGKETLVNDYL